MVWKMQIPISLPPCVPQVLFFELTYSFKKKTFWRLSPKNIMQCFCVNGENWPLWIVLHYLIYLIIEHLSFFLLFNKMNKNKTAHVDSGLRLNMYLWKCTSTHPFSVRHVPFRVAYPRWYQAKCRPHSFKSCLLTSGPHYSRIIGTGPAID